MDSFFVTHSEGRTSVQVFGEAPLFEGPPMGAASAVTFELLLAGHCAQL